MRAIETSGGAGGVLNWAGCALLLMVAGIGWAMRNDSLVEPLYESTVTVGLGDKFAWESEVLALDDGSVLERLGDRFELSAEERARLAGRVDVEAIEGEGLHRVTVTWGDADLAADLANGLVDVYDELRREAFAEGTRRELSAKIEAQKVEVEEARLRLMEVMERVGDVDADEG